MKLEARKTCRICNSECLSDIISLGEQNIAAYTPKGSDPKPVLEKFPLELIRCCEQDCGLVQLRHSTPPDILYERYFYRSGINQTMTDNLKEIVENKDFKFAFLQESEFACPPYFINEKKSPFIIHFKGKASKKLIKKYYNYIK